LTVPHTPEPPWNFLTPLKRLRRVEEPASLIAKLQREFSVADLAAAKVIVPDAENQSAACPVLSAGDAPFLVLMSTQYISPIIDVISGAVVPELFASTWPTKKAS
jgi:hypothetical protein